jgi:hypothetical protein
MRAIPSNKTKMVRIILLNISFIGTSKNKNRRQNDCSDSGPTIVGFLRRYLPRPNNTLNSFLKSIIVKTQKVKIFNNLEERPFAGRQVINN